MTLHLYSDTQKNSPSDSATDKRKAREKGCEAGENKKILDVTQSFQKRLKF
jgi:hypothetical protein